MKSVKRKSATSAFLRSRVIVAVRGSAAGRTRDPEASEGPTLVLLNASQPSSHSANGNRAETGMNAFRSSSSWCVMESAERRIATLLSLLKPGPGDILLDAAATERLLLGHHALTGDSHPLLSVAKRKKHLCSVSTENTSSPLTEEPRYLCIASSRCSALSACLSLLRRAPAAAPPVRDGAVC